MTPKPGMTFWYCPIANDPWVGQVDAAGQRYTAVVSAVNADGTLAVTVMNGEQSQKLASVPLVAKAKPGQCEQTPYWNLRDVDPSYPDSAQQVGV